MKAESIEQIREHLAKGGRVLDSDDREVDLITPRTVFTKCNWPWLVKDLTSEELSNWQLLPLEEKEPVAMSYDQVCEALKQKRRVRFFWRDFPNRSFIVPSVFGKDGIVVCNEHDASNQWTVYWEWVTERGYCQAEEPVDFGKLPESLGKTLGKRISDAFAEHGITQKSLEPVDHGTQKAIEVRTWGAGTIERVVVRCDKHGDLWFVDVDEDDSDNAKLVLHREDATKLGRWLLGEPDGTQKGQDERDWSGVYPKDCYAFRDSQKERMQRIRQRLLHGQWPEMSDLLDWWEATTGERIE